MWPSGKCCSRTNLTLSMTAGPGGRQHRQCGKIRSGQDRVERTHREDADSTGKHGKEGTAERHVGKAVPAGGEENPGAEQDRRGKREQLKDMLEKQCLLEEKR